jgi:hypothetical protein
MHRSKFTGLIAFPVLSFLMLSGPARGQNSESSQTSSSRTPSSEQIAVMEPPTLLGYSSSDQTGQAETAPAATQDSAQNPPPAPTEAQRAQLARQAQDRVRARRAQRIQAIVQDTYSHKYEVYGGYTFVRLRPGANLQNVDENGFDAGVTRYFSNTLGVTAEGRGYFGNAYVGNLGTGITFFEPSISNYSISAGPQYRFYMHQRWGISGIGEVGVARNVFYANSQSLPGEYVGLYPNEWRITATVAVPFDYNLGPGLSIRISPTYYLTTFGGQTQNNRGFTSGINYRFGRR